MQPYLILAAAGAVAATAMLAREPEAAPQPRTVLPQIGVPADEASVHLIDRPGLYGVSDPAPGMRYAVIGSSLVRIEPDTNIVRAVIRGGVRPLD